MLLSQCAVVGDYLPSEKIPFTAPRRRYAPLWSHSLLCGLCGVF